MNEQRMETLARRLDRVERENRRLKMVGVAILVVIFLAGCQQKTEFQTCIEYLEQQHGGKTPPGQATRFARLCSRKGG